MPDVTLHRCTAAQRPALEAMFQLYVHDFTSFWPERRLELGEDGRFPAYPHMDGYWSEPDREPLLIRAAGRLAGFALINRHSHIGEPCDFAMAEFFVARHYRREGVGRAAALTAIRARPGLWEIAVARPNVDALPFWRGVAAAAAPGRVAEMDLDNAHWNGAILRVQAG